MISITAITGGDKTVEIRALADPRKNADEADVKVAPVKITLKDAPAGEDPADPGALAFDTDVDIGATTFKFVVGEEKSIDLPDVKGGADGAKTYATSALPAGLSFDADALTISGVPTAVGETTVIYTVLDSVGTPVATTVMLEVLAAPPPRLRSKSV